MDGGDLAIVRYRRKPQAAQRAVDTSQELNILPPRCTVISRAAGSANHTVSSGPGCITVVLNVVQTFWRTSKMQFGTSFILRDEGGNVVRFSGRKEWGMSRANKQLSKQLITLARKSGGSFKTVSDRARIASRFAESMYVEIKYPDTRCQ